MAKLNWKVIVEFSYVLVMAISLTAIFFSLYPSWGVASAAILTVITAFLEAVLGYIIFEKVLD
jgi:uncharacterized membrane protein